MSQKIKSSAELPQPTRNDVLEACEMLRASMCINRQAFSIVFMSQSITGEDIKQDVLKDFAYKFDDVNAFYHKIYKQLADMALVMEDKK